MTSDLDLLEKFVRENSQDAFGEIVRRHLDLVYSAALRQVRSPQLAEEIAQSVFADLARNARKIGSKGVEPANSLTPWLYAVTRRTAIDVIRKESRRQLREQIAVEMNNMNAMENSAGVPLAWSEIEKFLDDAMAVLDETDRSAVLLRYFENKSLHEVGETLGMSEDAAQKRVSRAVDRLREFFTKRNITIGASGLAILISANAVQAAPAGLAVAISTAALAGTVFAAPTAVATTKAIVLTVLQKTLITATVAVLAGAGIYEARQASQLHEQDQMLRQQQAPLAEQIRQLQYERDEATNRLAGLWAENEQLKSDQEETELLKLRGQITLLQNELAQQAVANDETTNTTPLTEGELNNQLAKLLIRYFEDNPGAQIPEMKLLPQEERPSWAIYGLAVKLAAQNDPANYGKLGFFDENRVKLQTTGEYRRAASELRSYAECSFAPKLCAALKGYLQANNGSFPGSVSELQPFFDSPIDKEILRRYEIEPASDFQKIQAKYAPSARLTGLAMTPMAAIDNDYDHRIIIGPTNYMVGDSGSYRP